MEENKKESLLSSFIKYFYGNFVVLLLGLVQLPLTTRILATDEYGKTTMFTTAVTVIYIFAILGLRALYFALAAVAKYFTYLKYGLGIILIFVGVKMLLAMNEYINMGAAWLGFDLHMPHIEIPTIWSLAFIFGTLILSMGLSYLISKPNKN